MRRLMAMIMVIASAGGGCAAHDARPRRASVIVQPVGGSILQRNGIVDMFLHAASNGGTYLYVEGEDGHRLSIFDVTYPATVRPISEVVLNAKGPFLFVQDINQDNVLVQYRGMSGYAELNFTKYKHPLLSQNAELASASTVERLGDSTLLLGSGAQPSRPEVEKTYTIVDTAQAGDPQSIAAIPGVRRRLANSDTGTLFLLTGHGITMVRDLITEEHRALEISAANQ
jgi:hypothetical protein